jgi:hypothetical protein
MYFFFHLFAGIIIGLFVGELLHDRRWAIPCAIGAVLPDLIDKPVGHILFRDAIGYGRIYAHTLLFCFVIMVLGLVILKYKKNPVVLALSLGILSHQVLDLMWLEPVNWLYPYIGSFEGHLPSDYWYSLFSGEISNPLEVILALVFLVGIILFLNIHRITGAIAQHKKIISGMLFASSLLLLAASGIILGYGLVKKSLPYLGWTRPEEYFFGGIVIAGASYLLWRNKVKYYPEIPGYR